MLSKGLFNKGLSKLNIMGYIQWIELDYKIKKLIINTPVTSAEKESLFYFPVFSCPLTCLIDEQYTLQWQNSPNDADLQ